MVDREGMVCGFLFLLVVAGYTSVAAIVIAEKDKDDNCIRGKRGGIDVADWLLGQGILGTIECFIFFVSAVMSENYLDAARVLRAAWALIGDIFGLIWIIWGIVIISTNENSDCIYDGTRVGIFSLVLIVLQFVVLCCKRCFR